MSSQPPDRLAADGRRALHREATQRFDSLLRDDPAFAEGHVRRREAALLSVATVFHQRLPRADVRAIARESCRTATTRHLRAEGAHWEPFVVDGAQYLDPLLQSGEGFLVASFHLAQYRLLSGFFLAKGRSVVWLADKENAGLVESQFTKGRIARAMSLGAPSPGADGRAPRLTCVASSSKTAVWEIVRGLRSGAAAVVFPDGNNGSTEPTSTNTTLIQFLGEPVQVRVGAAMLAYAAGVPVLPVIPLESADQRPAIRVEAPIRPTPGETAREFSARVMPALFRLLEAEVLEAPSGWEEWHNLYRWFRKDAAPPLPLGNAAVDVKTLQDRRLALASTGVWWFELLDQPRAIDVAGWRSLGTSPQLRDVIEAAEHGVVVREWLTAASDPLERAAALSHLLAVGAVRLEETPQ